MNDITLGVSLNEDQIRELAMLGSTVSVTTMAADGEIENIHVPLKDLKISREAAAKIMQGARHSGEK